MANSVEPLLQQWENAYKKGLLSFWILLLLHDQWKYAYEMADAIEQFSKGTIIADEKSIYRALKRFNDNGIIQSEMRESEIGPSRRYYTLTALGQDLLAQFIQRNILLFQDADIREAIEAVLPK